MGDRQGYLFGKLESLHVHSSSTPDIKEKLKRIQGVILSTGATT
jgi:hypothetical protein